MLSLRVLRLVWLLPMLLLLAWLRLLRWWWLPLALFVVVMSSALLLVAIFPEIALWLPRVLGYAV